MVTLFDIQDLASFGNYMVSEYRERTILEDPNLSEEDKKKFLRNVIKRDIDIWFSLTSENQKDESNSEVPEEDKPIKEDNKENKSKIVKLNPKK